MGVEKDCRFYEEGKGKCNALKEIYCKNEKCKFYKPKKDNKTK